MSNRFKFRAWDIKEKAMYYEAEKTYDNLAGHYGFGDFNDLVQEHNESVILMQCTGLKDSVNMLVYENDILECVLSGLKYVVKFCNHEFHGFGFKLNPVKYKDLDEAIELEGYLHDFEIELNEFCEYSQFKNLKIIGNIHEHKHLLK